MEEGQHVPSIERLLARVWAWNPESIISDPYRAAELHQVVAGRVRIIERARGGTETVSNVQALRSRLLDSEAGVTEKSKALLQASFEQTTLTVDGSGLIRVNKARAKRSRDDATAALLLVFGAMARRPAPLPLKAAFIGKDRSVTWI